MVYGTTKEIIQRIGVSIKQHRLEQNITQQQLADRCGVSISSVKSLESGKGSTLETFLQVTRALNKDGWVSYLEPVLRLSPLEYADMVLKGRKKHQRRRASGQKGGT